MSEALIWHSYSFLFWLSLKVNTSKYLSLTYSSRNFIPSYFSYAENSQIFFTRLFYCALCIVTHLLPPGQSLHLMLYKHLKFSIAKIQILTPACVLYFKWRPISTPRVILYWALSPHQQSIQPRCSYHLNTFPWSMMPPCLAPPDS
jgi:hypothetical protein